MIAGPGIREAIESLARALAGHGAPHMLIGGIAVIARGVVRTTDDVDATVWGPDTQIPELLEALAGEDIKPRIADVEEFARQSQVLLLVHTPSGVPMEVSLAWLPFEEDALKRSDPVSMGTVTVPVATPEDLIVYKAVASRERDRSDIERLLILHASAVDIERVRRRVAEFAEILDKPELLTTLDDLVRRASGG